MTCICLGGVCIPLSAVVPFLIFALQYIAKPLYDAGLLPEIIAKRIGLSKSTTTQSVEKTEEGSNSKKSCCCANPSSSDNGEEEILTIESLEDYKDALSAYDSVFIKFTAEWCKPCKEIHNFFVSDLARNYNGGKSTKFAIADVDEVDEVAAECKVSVLPCFVVIKGGKIVGKYTGSDEIKLETFVKEQLVA